MNIICKFIILLFLLQFSSLQAAIESPNKYITKLAKTKSNLSEKYTKVANTIDSMFNVGTAHNEEDSDTHLCFITGVLLGKRDLVKNLNKTYKPNLKLKTEDNARQLRIIAISYDNFVYIAKSSLKKSNSELSHEWNLNCAGKHGLPNEYSIQDKQTTFFKYNKDSHTLEILGDIQDGFAQQLINAFNSHPKARTIALGSGGGSVKEALEAGWFIRRHRLDTTLWNGCYSACPLVFLGGVNRTIFSPYPVLGLHQIYKKNGMPLPTNDPVYASIYSYIKVMGANPKYVISNMLVATPTQMNEIMGYDSSLCKYNVATWIQRNCSNSEYGYPSP